MDDNQRRDSPDPRAAVDPVGELRLRQQEAEEEPQRRSTTGQSALPPLPPTTTGKSPEPGPQSGQPGTAGHPQQPKFVEKRLSGPAAGLILLAEGYASLSAEVMALRMMMAYAGTGVITTSILLATYLTALGVGYTRGEKLARRTVARNGRLRDKIAFRLAAAAAWTAVWVSDIGRAAVFEGSAAVGDLPMLANIGIYSAGASITGYLLAQTVCLVHYARQRNASGPHAGSTRNEAAATTAPPPRVAPVWTISTIGNVLGTLLTSMAILTIWGVAAALGTIVGLLLLATVLARPRELPAVTMTAAAMAVGGAVVIEIDTYVDRTAYADYIIADETPGSEAKVLVINNSLASRDDREGTGWNYIEWTENDFCESGGGRILVLGAAGRTFGRGVDEAECAIDPVFIDIDAAQEAIAEQFLYGDPPGPLRVDDARRYLAGQSGWDAVFADAYNRTDQTSEHLVTREFFQETRNALKNNGLLYVNLLTRSDDENLTYETRVDRTIRSVYAHCRQSAGGRPETPWQNTMYRCRRTRIDGDAVIYSDMRVSAEMDTSLETLLPETERNEQ